MTRVRVLAAASAIGLAVVLSGCGGSEPAPEAAPLDVATAPDAFFAAGIECRNPDVREYKVWETPYRKLVCFGGPSGQGDWAVNVQTFGSADIFTTALTEYCGGRETTSSGGFLSLEGAAIGSNWIASIEGTSATDESLTPTPEELAKALGGTAVASLDEACAIAKDDAASS